MAEKKGSTKLALKIFLAMITLVMIAFVAEGLFRLGYPLYANYNTEMARYARELKVIVNDRYFKHCPNRSGRYYNVIIKTNSMGWREDKDYSIEKPDGVKRIIILGDSITMGWGVVSEETYVKVLARLLNADNDLRHKFEVINTGVGNYNTALEFKMLQQALGYDPDLIIIGWYLNDVETWEQRGTLTYFLGKKSYFYTFLWDRLFSIFTRLSLRDNYKTHIRNLYIKNQKGLLNFDESFIAIVDNARERNISILVMNIPDLHHLMPYPFEIANNYIDRIAEKKGVPVLHLLELVKDLQPETLWVSNEDPHPNSYAHGIYGQALYRFVKTEGFVD